MIISAAILLLILFPIVLAVLLSITTVQNRIISYATSYASDFLGTEVSIGRVDVTMRGGLEVCDFLVRDMQADSLIYIERVESRLSLVGLMQRDLHLGHSTVSGAQFFLRARATEDGGSEMNIRQIALKLAGKGNSPIEVFVESVTVDNTSVSIEQLTHRNPVYGVDTRNIKMSNLSGSVSHLAVNGSAVHAYVERLSGVEQSGFTVNDISGELYLTEGAIALSEMTLESRWSSLMINQLLIVGGAWREYRQFEHNVLLDIDIEDGRVSSDDLAYFAPAVRDWGVTLQDIELMARGEVKNLLLNIRNISYGESTNLTADISLQGLPVVDNTTVQVDDLELSTSAMDIDLLTWSVSGNSLSEETLSKVETLGDIYLSGDLAGGLDDLTVRLDLESDVGRAESSMQIKMSDGVGLVGNLSVEAMDLGAILGRDDLGRVSLLTVVDGVVDGVDSRGDVQGCIESIELANNTLEGIYIDANIGDGGLERFDIECRDDDLDFDISGRAPQIFSSEEMPSYRFNMDLRKADLNALKINRRDTLSQLSASFAVAGAGRDIEHFWGRVDVKQGEYLYDRDTLTTSDAMLHISSEEGARSITSQSEYGELHFASSSRVSHILEFLSGALVDYLPALYDDPQGVKSKMARWSQEEGGEMSTFDFVTYDVDPLMNAINSGLKIGNGAKIAFGFDPNTRYIDASIDTPYIEQGSNIALNLKMEAVGRADSLLMNGSVGELFVGTSFVEETRISALAKGDRVVVDGGFVNPIDSATVNLGATVDVANSAPQGRTFDVRILPSQLLRRNMEWNISAQSVLIGREGVDIDSFRIENDDQLMTVNGRASRSADDEVVMTMQDFDLSIFSTLIEQLGYRIEGRTNGEAKISSALDGGRFDAEIELDSVRVNTLAAPPMRLTTEWDSRRNRARLFLTDRVLRDTLIRGYYIPSGVKYYAVLDVDSLQMGILDPPLGGVIENTTGYADLSLVLMGERRNAHLNGVVSAYDIETTVGYTKVRYRMPKVTINVLDNLLQIASTPIDYVDPQQEDRPFVDRGDVGLQVDLQHLSNIGYKVRITPRDLMVLNTQESDNDVFYGQIFASGVADIEGDKSGVKMNIVAQSADNSHFFMPLMSKSNISTVDFITFVQPTTIDTTDMSSLKRQVLTRKGRVRGAGTMQMDMSLDVSPNTELQLVIDPTVGDIIKARGEGNLNLRIEPKSNIFDIYGDYTISEGNYLFTLRNIVNKRFTIDPGSSIQWTGVADDPILDINAIYKLRTSLQPLISDESSNSVPVNCIINLSDRLSQPDVSFAIEIPSSDAEQQAVLANLLNDQESVSRQFFYLVLANSFISDSSTGGSSDLGVSTTAATGFELLTNQLSNWLSTSNYNVIIRYRPESELMGEEVDFGFSKGLINNRLLVELEGNYIIDNKQAISEDASNFLGEAYITWLIDQAGALKLRGFTQTIDRFDENQGLQETGIGLYYREDFENFKDLHNRVRARFKASDERLERRAERRAERKGESADTAESVEGVIPDEEEFEEND